MRRAAQLRLFKIAHRLQQGEYIRIDSLAEEYGCSRRTVQRDIDDLRTFYCMPLEYSHRHRSYYCPDRNFRLHQPLRFTEGELLALYLGRNILSQCTGTVLEDTVRHAFDRISSLLPEEVSFDSASLLDNIFLELPPLRGDGVRTARFFNQLTHAIEKRQSVDIIYRAASTNAQTRRTADPYRLYYRNGAWYLVAWCHIRSDMRYFALDRIIELQITGRPFPIPDDLDINAWVSQSFGLFRDNTVHDAVIHFDSFQARWIRERRWHHTQSIEEHPDGSLILHMTACGLEGIKRWVLSYGCHAEVLAPAKLREMVRAEVQDMGEIYEKKNNE